MSQATEQIARQYANSAANKAVWGGILSNVKVFGAKGDGFNDDSAAIQAAIDACEPGGTVFLPAVIPAVSAKYRCNSTLTIDKPMKFMGFHSVYDFSGGDHAGTVLEFGEAVTTCIHVTGLEVAIENLAVRSLSSAPDFNAGIHLDGATSGSCRGIQIRNVNVYLNYIYGFGIKGNNVITSTFENVKCHLGAVGFYFFEEGTSLLFQRTWAINQFNQGYYIEGYGYCSFVNTAADSQNGSIYAYRIVGCNNISFSACGAELVNNSMYRIDNSTEIGMYNCTGFVLNKSGTAVARFAEVTGTSRYVTFEGCGEFQVPVSAIPDVKCTSIYNPVMVNCKFPNGFENSTGVRVNTLADASASIQLGNFVINEKANQSVAVLDGMAVASRARAIGVMSNDLNSFLGYIDGDGAVVVGKVSALPAADDTQHGKTYVLVGGPGVADTYVICMKSAAGTYSWKPIVTG